MLKYNFACIIISHGRPKDIPTISSLLKAGYSGKFYILIDSEDKKKKDYEDLYSTNVIVFDKQKYIDNNDLLFNKSLRNVAVHARNAAEEVALKLHLNYYLLLDDDITSIHYRFSLTYLSFRTA